MSQQNSSESVSIPSALTVRLSFILPGTVPAGDIFPEYTPPQGNEQDEDNHSRSFTQSEITR